MINKKDFQDMRKELASFDSLREKMIKESRDVIIYSKKVINGLHRRESVESHIKTMTAQLKKINSLVSKNESLYHQGTYKAAVQEYVEAMLYYGFVKNNKLTSRKELDVGTEYYLLGLCDLTGELVRRAIREATKGNYEKVIDIRDFIDSIFTELIQADFRNGELRRKFDSIKYDLRKLEDLVLDLKLKDKLK